MIPRVLCWFSVYTRSKFIIMNFSLSLSLSFTFRASLFVDICIKFKPALETPSSFFAFSSHQQGSSSINSWAFWQLNVMFSMLLVMFWFFHYCFFTFFIFFYFCHSFCAQVLLCRVPGCKLRVVVVVVVVMVVGRCSTKNTFWVPPLIFSNSPACASFSI